MARKSSRKRSKSTPAARPAPLPDIWIVAGLVAATLVAYGPAWHGGLLRDDTDRLMHAARAPVAHAVFWLQQKLWGDATTGYHLVSILLHAASAYLLLRILRLLAVPGAALAAVIFALHPVHVESVAWISQQTWTLAAVFGLGSALLYLRQDRQRWAASDPALEGTAAIRPEPSAATLYIASLVLFVLALLSKSAIALLPAVMVAIAWWQRGRVDVRRDLTPLAPFVALGVVAGAVAVWLEVSSGASAAAYSYSFIERGLIAGRAIWFYLATLVWPWSLTFNYPRWNVSQSIWWQYLFPLAAVGLGIACWAVRGRTRAPLAVYLMFVGLLAPMLGFLNLSPFRFSFVADHFLYVASIPVIALLAAALTLAVQATNLRRALVRACLAVLVGGLGVLTYQQARPYASAEALNRRVLERNPNSWMAHSSLAVALMGSNTDEALFHANEAVRLNPADPDVHNDRGSILQRVGETEMAIAEFREAIRLGPSHYPAAHNNLCSSLGIMGSHADAIASCQEALRQAPDLADAHYNLGIAMLGTGNLDAAAEFEAAARLRPGLAEPHYYLAGILRIRGQQDDARRHYEESVRLKPEFPDGHYGLAVLLQEMGFHDDAIRHFETALRLEPSSAQAHNSLGLSLIKAGRRDDAIKHFEEAVRLMPSLGPARANLINAREGKL